MIRIVLPLLSIAALAVPARPSAAAITEFASTSQFQVTSRGTPDPNARVYRSMRPPWQFLVTTFAFPRPVLVTTGPAGARLVDPKRITPDPGDPQVMRLDTSGPVEDLLTIRFEGPKLVIDRDGVVVTLAPSPPVLGNRTLEELVVALPEYRRNAAAYTPDPAALARLRTQDEPVELQVFFGSWCSHCESVLPRLVRVLDDAKPPKLTVSFHGVPQGRTSDPEADAAGISALPTGIVRRDGKEVARLVDDDWEAPERSLAAAIGGTKAPAAP